MGNYAKGARFHEVDESDAGELFQPYVKSLTNEDLSKSTIKKSRGMALLCSFKRESLKYQKCFSLKTFLKLLGLFVTMTFPRIFWACMK